jgi:hypothetical protein
MIPNAKFILWNKCIYRQYCVENRRPSIKLDDFKKCLRSPYFWKVLSAFYIQRVLEEQNTGEYQ